MNIAQTLPPLFALGALALNALLVVGIAMLFSAAWRARLMALARAHGRVLIFLVAGGAVLGSLLMQYAVNVPPCLLCWWQRIFMYPIPLLAFVAIVKNSDVGDLADYILPLSFLGALVALYQHLLQMLPTGALIPCDPSNDCAVRSVFEFNFVTLPWMSFSAFALLIFIALLARKRS